MENPFANLMEAVRFHFQKMKPKSPSKSLMDLQVVYSFDHIANEQIGEFKYSGSKDGKYGYKYKHDDLVAAREGLEMLDFIDRLPTSERQRFAAMSPQSQRHYYRNHPLKKV